jgi:nicotinamidase-related amidase
MSMPPVVPARTALVNIYVQNAFLSDVADGPGLIRWINELASARRSRDMLVIHTRHVLRPDGSNLGVLKAIPKIYDGILSAGSQTAALHKTLDVHAGDVLVDKPRFGGFYGTDLELMLRANGIDTIIVSGISSPVCCDTTARRSTRARLPRAVPLRWHGVHRTRRRTVPRGNDEVLSELRSL